MEVLEGGRKRLAGAGVYGRSVSIVTHIPVKSSTTSSGADIAERAR